MSAIRGWAAAALLGIALYATNVVQARAAEPDPAVWGVYAQLVGTSWQGKFGTRSTRWGEGNQIIEDDSSFGRSVITPGPTRGTLTLELGSSGLHTFQGTVASDGSVLWIRDGMLKQPYRVLLRDGELVEEAVKLNGREVASVKRAMTYQHVGGTRNAQQSTLVAIPVQPPAPVATASTTIAAQALPAQVATTSTAKAGAVVAVTVESTPTSMGVGAVQIAYAQPATKDIAAALSYFDAIDAGNWEAARKKRADSSEYTADQLKESWSKWAEARRSEKNWRGVASEEWTEGGVTEVFVPIAATDGHSGIAVQLKAGLVTGMRIQPSYAKYGPYAYLTERAVVYTGGEVQRWHLAPTGRAVISELRGAADGLIRRMEIIKSSGVGSLLMLRSSECPDSVCGQVGTLQGGVAAWKVPMASGGWEGKFHNLKVWNDGNVLVMHYPDPPYNQTPQRLALINSPPMTQEQRAELHSKVSQLEPLVESQVAQEVSAQLGRSQRLSDRYAAEKRSSERVQRFNNAMVSMNGVLTAANEVATANEAQSRAELDATIAQMNAQAAIQRQQQTSTQANPQPTGARQQGQVGANGSASSASTSQASAIQSPATATPPAVGDLAKQNPVAAGQPLRFVLLISMRNLPGDKVNSTCYSNVITRPGPPGWGSPGFLPPGSGEQARETIESLKSQFIAQCQSSGRAISSEGNFNWLSNQTQEQAQRLGSTGAKYREDVSVQLN